MDVSDSFIVNLSFFLLFFGFLLVKNLNMPKNDLLCGAFL